MTIRALASLSAVALLVISGFDSPPAGPQGRPQLVPLAPDQIDLRPASATALLELINHSDAEVMLVNMWATWCMPCREEFPDIVRLHRAYAGHGLEVVFVSGDLEADLPLVLEFLAEQGVDFPSYLKVGKDMEFIETFYPEWSGLLPATFIYDADGSLQHFWEGEASYDVFERRVLAAFDQPPEIKPPNREAT